jgi:hypothetical protein
VNKVFFATAAKALGFEVYNCHKVHKFNYWRSPRSYTKETELWIDCVKLPVRSNLHPSNVVSHGFNFPALFSSKGRLLPRKPGMVGVNIARFVFPQALGKAAATYLTNLS